MLLPPPFLDNRLAIGAHLTAGKLTAPKLSPVDEREIAAFAQADADEVAAAVAAARTALPAWRSAPAAARRRALAGLRRELVDKRAELAATIVRETGKPIVEALFEVVTALECVKFIPSRAVKLLGERRVFLPQPTFLLKASRLSLEPYGVVALISPWNFPVAIPVGELLQALMTGNTVVFKPSEHTPFTGLLLGRLFRDAGLPPGVLNVVTGDGRTGAALVASEVDKVSFTGSVATGLAIGEVAARRGLPASMELGGKDAAIVRADCDLRTAPAGVTWGAMMNCGQGCSAVERVYVHESIFEEFVRRASSLAAALAVGDGADPKTEVGPLVSRAQRDKVLAHLSDAMSRGAAARAGGGPPPGVERGWFLAPTVLSGVDHSMAVMREETFGPVLPVMPFGRDDEAVRLANDSAYGLGASVWSRDTGAARELARGLRAGNVWINDVLFSHAAPQVPWGGLGLSGNGYTHGDAGLANYVHPCHVSADRSTKAKDAWFPYGPERIEFADAVIELLYGSNAPRRLARVPRVLRGARL